MKAIDRTPLRVDGDRLYLREVCPEDADGAYLGWMNDTEVTRYTESRFAAHTVESLEAYIKSVNSDDLSLFLAIVQTEDDRHVGNIKLGPIDWNHKVADIGIIIGDRAVWGQGIATEAIDTLAAHAFGEIGLHKLTAGCYAPNKGAIRAFERSHFEIEGVMKQQCLLDAEYIDVVRLGRIAPTDGGSADGGTTE